MFSQSQHNYNDDSKHSNSAYHLSGSPPVTHITGCSPSTGATGAEMPFWRRGMQPWPGSPLLGSLPNTGQGGHCENAPSCVAGLTSFSNDENVHGQYSGLYDNCISGRNAVCLPTPVRPSAGVEKHKNTFHCQSVYPGGVSGTEHVQNPLSKKTSVPPLQPPSFLRQCIASRMISQQQCVSNSVSCFTSGNDHSPDMAARVCLFNVPPPPVFGGSSSTLMQKTEVIASERHEHSTAHLTEYNSSQKALIQGSIMSDPDPVTLWQEDESWVQWFEDQNKSQHEAVSSSDVKIRHVQEDLLHFCNTIIEVRTLRNQAVQQGNRNLMGIEEQISITLKDLDKLRNQFSNPAFILCVKQVLEKRKQQHKRQNTARLRKKREQALERERWKCKEKDIDLKRGEVIAKEKQRQQENQLKKEADQILAEVRSKQEDLRNLKAVLEGLKSLRQARLNKGEPHGYISTKEMNVCFEKAIGRLMDILEKQEKEYKLEEHTLKVMMEDNPFLTRKQVHQCRDVSTGIQPERRKQEILQILFGKEGSSVNFGMESNETTSTFIQKRVNWDTFLCSPDHPLGSSIPVHWVLPPLSPSTEWKNFQTT